LVDSHFRYEADARDTLFGGLARTGVPSVYVEHSNLSAYIRTRLWWEMNTETPQIQEVYQAAQTAEHRHALETLVTPLLRKHGLALRLSRVHDHPSDTRR
jgi:hypothetical protein